MIWYEIRIKKENLDVLVDTTESLERAENLVEDLKKKGLDAHYITWNIAAEIPRQMGEV